MLRHSTYDTFRKGQAALSTIFLIGGIILLFGVSLALIAISFANSSIGFQAANRAEAIAQGGIRDAEIELLRNKDFSDAGYCVPAANVVNGACPSGYALVAVTQNSPSTGKVTATADATVNRRRRKVQAIYVIGTSTEVLPISFTTLTQ